MLTSSKEFQVLVCCGRGDRSASAQRLQALLDEGIDWSLLLTLAHRHRLAPLVYWHLEALDEHAVPEAVRRRLRHTFFENASWQLRFTGELRDLLQVLSDHGIIAVPYKGPVLAKQLYGAISLRESSDLDILVRRDDFARARELLLERGFTARRPLDNRDRAFMLRNRYAESLDGPLGLTVELHWGFTNADVAFPLALDELQPRLQELDIDGFEVPAFAAEDHLLILTVHGAKHLWCRLEWVCGVAELARTFSPVQWQVVAQRARETGSERTLLLGLLLAHELLEAPIPQDLLRRARRNPQVVLLFEDVKWLLAAEEAITESAEKFGSLHHDLFHFRLRERLRDRVRFLLYRFTTPSRPERWVAVRVGTHFLPVHAVFRPVRVMAKLVPALWWYATRKRARDLPSPRRAA
ncbi:MAG TPA: nucleotidyltransferase family protein [Longimicrobiaceae bacterium]